MFDETFGGFVRIVTLVLFVFGAGVIPWLIWADVGRIKRRLDAIEDLLRSEK